MNSVEKIRESLLVAKAQLRDEEAFLLLVKRHTPKLLYFIRQMLQRKDLADDVLQEVWATVYQKLPRLRASQAFSVWIYRIAYTEAVKVIRAESRYVEMPEGAEPETTETNSDEEFTDEDISLLNGALGRLKQPFREVLALKFIEEMSYEEISEVAGLPVGTVRSRIHYAKQALRRELEAMRHEREQ